MRPALRSGFHIQADGDGLGYAWLTEADLRDAIAGVADAAGYDVQTEVHLPGWGRIDVLVQDDPYTYVVEVKKTLNTARQVRLGLQQAYTYTQAWRSMYPRSGVVLPYLVGAEVSATADRFARGTAYEDVLIRTVGRFMYVLIEQSLRPERENMALGRLEAAQHEVKIRKAVIRAMPFPAAPTEHPAEVFAELVAEFGEAA